MIVKIEIPVQLAVIPLDLHMPNPQAVAWGAPCVRGMGGRDSQALKDGRCLGVCPQTLLSVLWCFGQGTDFLSSERPSEQTHNSDSRRSGSI